jgi:hypothetical protein
MTTRSPTAGDGVDPGTSRFDAAAVHMLLRHSPGAGPHGLRVQTAEAATRSAQGRRPRSSALTTFLHAASVNLSHAQV